MTAFRTEKQTPPYARDRKGARPTPVIAVENVCAWPNLTRLPGGELVVIIHNEPSHFKRPSDVTCWASENEGRTWTKRGTPAPRDSEHVARGNVAAGLSENRDLIAIVSGWSNPVASDRGSVLSPIVSRSPDGGHTWAIDRDAFPNGWATNPLIPYGDICKGHDGMLRAAFYGYAAGDASIYRSPDDGRSWIASSVIDRTAVIHEPALLHMGAGRWLAAARFDGLTLYRSNDDAATWSRGSVLTGHAQHPGHFLRLQDGQILLSYGNRQHPPGVEARVSDDEGQTWSEPFRILDFQGDGGYPSGVQLADGNVVTAYYAERIAEYDRYHMGVITWDPMKTCCR